jgi:cell division protein FtsX
MDPKLKFTILSTIIAFSSFFIFQKLHVWISQIVLAKNPHFEEQYPWLFTTRSHLYVFVIMLTKLGVVVLLLWFGVIGIPDFLRS